MGDEAANDNLNLELRDLGSEEEWETGLPSADELTPLSQSLVLPDPGRTLVDVHRASSSISFPSFQQQNQEADSLDNKKQQQESSSAVGKDYIRPRLVWTPALHRRFLDAVVHLGLNNAVPSKITPLMNVGGLTTEDVLSHLHRYWRYRERMMHDNSNKAQGPGRRMAGPDTEFNIFERILDGRRMAGPYTELNILERILDGKVMKPCRLDLGLLRTITKNFSDTQIIGKGGCGIVYKGILRNGIVAVKKLLQTHTVDEKMFDREVQSMLAVKHENIVQFLGYCSDTQGEALEIGGKVIMAEVRERLLCFEYIKNGSLHSHIKDELRGLEWHERYQIIKGICEGLNHLHKEKSIRHMDLKPDNILLAENLIPKITDFGLARLDEKTQTTCEERLFSRVYCAPEYRDHGKMSPKSDVYSLGVIILELVSGRKEDPDITRVLRRWRNRWNKSSEDTPILWYRQVAKCLDLAQWCKQNNPLSRPNIWDIICELTEIDSWDGQIKYATVSSFDKDMLGIEPLEMRFPFAINKPISCLIEVTNDTDDYFAFRISTTSLLPFSTQPDKGIVEPQSNLSATITLQARDKVLLQNHCSEEFTVQSFRINGIPASMDVTKDLFNDVVGRVVDEVNLTVVFDLQPATDQEAQIDIDNMKYQEADNATDEPHSRADNGSLGPSLRYKDAHVLQLILDGRESPRKLSFYLLESITENFSWSRIIGHSELTEVYEGTLPNGTVAVKRLLPSYKMEDKFSHEVEAMMRVQHQNIVRFLGYCSHTEEQVLEIKGRHVLAQHPERLLCFEYVSNGSLQNHLAGTTGHI